MNDGLLSSDNAEILDKTNIIRIIEKGIKNLTTQFFSLNIKVKASVNLFIQMINIYRSKYSTLCNGFKELCGINNNFLKFCLFLQILN